MHSFVVRDVRLFALLAGAILCAGCNDDPVVWPISADVAGDWLSLVSTYGPTVRAKDGTYEFRRGLDMVVPERTDVHSIAAGTVMLIEQITDVGGMRVQIDHGGYYSNYMNLLKVAVSVGDEVDPGEYIAQTGISNDMIEMLHFEIRKPGTSPQDCVHPLRILPYADRGIPKVEIMGPIDMTDPLAPKVTARAFIRSRELDLVRISAATFDAPPGESVDGLEPLSEQSWNMETWNAEQTAAGEKSMLDDPTPNGIAVAPQEYATTDETFNIDFTFLKLVAPADPTHLRIRIEAADIQGNVAVVDSP